MRIPALIIFQEDFKQRRFLDFLVSHISGSLPPHRYNGDLEISDRYIRFAGMDTLLNLNADFTISKDQIQEVYHGYDETYNVIQTRSLGLNWAPVRIKFAEEDDNERAVYVLAGYDTWGTNNKELYSFLMEWLS